jgi:hypothetical protein
MIKGRGLVGTRGETLPGLSCDLFVTGHRTDRYVYGASSYVERKYAAFSRAASLAAHLVNVHIRCGQLVGAKDAHDQKTVSFGNMVIECL